MRTWLLALALCAGAYADPAEVPRDAGWARLPDLHAPQRRDFRTQRVQVGDGPLLAYQNKPGSTNQYYLLDTQRPTLAAPFLTAERPVEIVDRLDRDDLLIHAYVPGYPWGLFVLNLPTGHFCSVDPKSTARNYLASVDGDRLYFYREVESTGVSYSFSDSGQVASEPRQVKLLFELTCNGPRQLSEVAFQRILFETRTGYLVVTSSAPPRLACLLKTGRERILADLPADLVVHDLTLSLSPDESMAALGCLTASERFFGTRSLLVLRMDTGSVVCRLEHLPTEVSFASSLERTLHMGWQDARTLRLSVSERTEKADPKIQQSELGEGYFRWLDVDVDTGRTTDCGRYAAMGLYHSWPDEPDIDTSQLGDFRSREGKVFMHSSPEPLGSLDSKMCGPLLAMSYDGHWLAFQDAQNSLCLADRGGARTRIRPDGWQMVWLPAVGPVTEPPWPKAVTAEWLHEPRRFFRGHRWSQW